MPRRFKPPWTPTPERIPGGYVVKDATGQALAYVYARETRAEADTAKVLTMDEARRVAANIAKLPDCSAANNRPCSHSELSEKSDKSSVTGGLCGAIESAIEPNTMFCTWAWGEQILVHKEPITAGCFGHLDKSKSRRHLVHFSIGHHRGCRCVRRCKANPCEANSRQSS